MTALTQFLRVNQVVQLTALKRSTIYERIKDKAHPFPAPRKCGRASVWEAGEVTDYMDALPRAALGASQ